MPTPVQSLLASEWTAATAAVVVEADIVIVDVPVVDVSDLLSVVTTTGLTLVCIDVRGDEGVGMDGFDGSGLAEVVDGDDSIEEVDGEPNTSCEVDVVGVVGEFETVEVVKVLIQVPQSITVIVEGGEEAEETVEELVEVKVASDLAALAV
jgi:hypothetical protein